MVSISEVCFPRKGLFDLNLCNGFDLAQNAFGQFLHRAAASGRLSGEIFGIDRIECGEIRHVGDEAGGLDHLFRGGASGFQKGADIAAALLGLGGDAFGDGTGGRIHGDLTGAVNKIAGDDSLGIGTNGCGGMGGGDDLHGNLPFVYSALGVCRNIRQCRRVFLLTESRD